MPIRARCCARSGWDICPPLDCRRPITRAPNTWYVNPASVGSQPLRSFRLSSPVTLRASTPLISTHSLALPAPETSARLYPKPLSSRYLALARRSDATLPLFPALPASLSTSRRSLALTGSATRCADPFSHSSLRTVSPTSRSTMSPLRLAVPRSFALASSLRRRERVGGEGDTCPRRRRMPREPRRRATGAPRGAPGRGHGGGGQNERESLATAPAPAGRRPGTHASFLYSSSSLESNLRSSTDPTGSAAEVEGAPSAPLLGPAPSARGMPGQSLGSKRKKRRGGRHAWPSVPPPGPPRRGARAEDWVCLARRGLPRSGSACPRLPGRHASGTSEPAGSPSPRHSHSQLSSSGLTGAGTARRVACLFELWAHQPEPLPALEDGRRVSGGGAEPLQQAPPADSRPRAELGHRHCR